MKINNFEKLRQLIECLYISSEFVINEKTIILYPLLLFYVNWLVFY